MRVSLRWLQDYIDLGLDLERAINAVEAGIHKVWLRMSTGRLKVFKSCQNWLSEFRIYRRDEKGHIVKENDHLMDSTRYLVQECERTDFMITRPIRTNQAGLTTPVFDEGVGY